MYLQQLEYRRFSPRNGEIILKVNLAVKEKQKNGFSPRNGEIILKLDLWMGDDEF